MPPKPARAPDSPLRVLIREAMRERGIQSVDGPRGLAARAGVARNTIYAWETGSYFAAAELQKVAAILEVPVWRLVKAWERAGDDETSPPAWAEGLVENRLLPAIRDSRDALIDDLGRRVGAAVATAVDGRFPPQLLDALARAARASGEPEKE